MYITSMVLEGFKSYGKRIEINDFDKEFNAITGFNGSGKSNILDAICFVLGITDLQQVRVQNLQQLIYKSGQAGIDKASVTIKFNNRNKDTSPIGYEQYNEITVTRQIIMGGKTKYLVNGSAVTNKVVEDMFCSVQLNVNNPHFLIMQGRITKVLNMKPVEILAMIEEAAGTRMYENKRTVALKTIEKKEVRLTEVNTLLNDEVGPKIAKLKEKKMDYAKFQTVERELEHFKRICIAWEYVTGVNNSEKTEKNVKMIQDKINSKTEMIAANVEEIKQIEDTLLEINRGKDTEQSQRLVSLTQSLQEAEKVECALGAEMNSTKENIKAAVKTADQLKANIADEENTLAAKHKDLEKFGGLFDALKEADEKDAEALRVAQENYQSISMGLLQSDSGENATLEQQLMSIKQNVAQAQTEIKQCEMSLAHYRSQLKEKEKEMVGTEKECAKDNKELESKMNELKSLENELSRMNYKEGYIEELQGKRQTLRNEIRMLQDKLDCFESKYPQIRFEYQDPGPDFSKSSINGVVCKLINIKDKQASYALEIAAGGKLYDVIVNNEKTSKKLLQYGKLQRRVTFIPLNRVKGRVMDQHTIALAQKLVGQENVQLALSLVDFPEAIRPAVTWILGQIFICKDMNVAKQVAFHRGIMKKCVTLEGDVVDPAGTLSGGAPARGGGILLQLEEMKLIQNELNRKEQELKRIETELEQVSQRARNFAAVKQKYDLLKYKIDLVRQKLEEMPHHKIRQEVESFKANITELTEKIAQAKKLEMEKTKRAAELESQLKDSGNIRDKQLKEAEKKVNMLKEKANKSRNEWEKRRQESDVLNMEIKELTTTLESGKEQLTKVEEEIKLLNEKLSELKERSNEAKEKVKNLQEEIKEINKIMNQQNNEMKRLNKKKDDILKGNQEAELEIKKLNHDLNTITDNIVHYKRKVKELVQKYEWIEQDKAYFGKEGSIYDFKANDPEKLTEKIHQLEISREKLSRNIDSRAISLLDKKEEQYNALLKRKEIVETDKKKILYTIQCLDERKKKTLLEAWEQVNKDFGSIFSSLLPGAEAKLQPKNSEKITEGLEVRVGFSGVWKESLTELSGGQRSLVALSLILAMLLFNPAPVYILDEVDAALDLSHTENIGVMLKRHFNRSQFIVVSLKDGMYNKANVVFTAKFVDGMSTVIRTERSRRK